MKIYQNRVCRLFVFAGLVAALAVSSLISAQAQTATIITNGGPVNLLGLSPSDSKSKGNAQGAPETTIEDAFMFVTDNGTSSSAIDLSSQQAVPSATLPARNLTGNATAVEAEQTAVQTEQSAMIEESTVTIGLREVEDVGLAAIGVGQSADGAGNLDELIWRGTAASRATFLFENGSLASQSRAISSLALEVVAREAVPPAGANTMARA